MVEHIRDLVGARLLQDVVERCAQIEVVGNRVAAIGLGLLRHQLNVSARHDVITFGENLLTNR